MKRLSSTLVLILVVIMNLSAQQNSMPKLSPLTRIYLSKIKDSKATVLPEYVYQTGADNSIYISALIKVNDAADAGVMEAMGIKIGTKAGKVWTARVPLDKVEAFTKLGGMDYIQLDEPVFPALDSARKTTRVDSAQAGYGLSVPMNGEGVVTGIVDAGFDYSHPAFFDTTGTGFRIKKVWEQKTSGTPPAGFSFGNEMTDSLEMWNKGDDNGGTHGTHVAGIAAGSGYGSSVNHKRFRGMAYRSDLVFVGITPDKSQWKNTGAADIIDGIHYVYNYAASVSKPAVVNLSWGSPLGPRDGSSLFGEACDNLTGTGKVFVCSAGNSGERKIHINKTFTPSDTVVSTFLDIATNPLGKVTWVDIWGDTAKTFCAQVTLYNGNIPIDSTGFICLDNSLHSFYFIGTNSDTFFVDVVTSDAEFNQQPRIFMEMRSKVNDSICISIKGMEGTIHIWNNFVHETTGYTGTFTSNNYPWAIDGNTDITISDIASTKSAITVGAYASKVSFKNLNNATLGYSVQYGKLAPFSSHGPARFGSNKPDITGPGLTLASSVSSYDLDFTPTGSNYAYAVAKYDKPSNSRTYLYAVLSGTSMSSPSTAGIVALLLQLKPDLTATDVKSILKETAIKDAFTTTTPVGTLWGAGKVNAMGALRKVMQLLNVKDAVSGNLEIGLYPNPNDGQFNLAYAAGKNEVLQVDIYDIGGRLTASEKWNVTTGENMKSFDFELIPAAYFVKIRSVEKEKVLKMVVR